MNDTVKALQKVKHELANASEYITAGRWVEGELALAKVVVLTLRLRLYLSSINCTSDQLERVPGTYTDERSRRLTSNVWEELHYVERLTAQLTHDDLMSTVNLDNATAFGEDA